MACARPPRRAGRFVAALIPAVLLGYVVMALVWPWAVIDPLNPFRALGYFSHFFEEPWQELFGGAADLGARHAAQLRADAVRAEAAGGVLARWRLIGTAGAIVAACRRDVPLPRRAVYLLVALAASLPVAVTIALRPAMYNGIRHFMFVLPPLAVLGGLAGGLSARGSCAAPGAAGDGRRAASRSALRCRSSRWCGCIRSNTPTSTGWPAASPARSDRYMLDYWGLSLKQASQGLLAKPAGRSQPAGRRWKIAVCGPHRSPQVELGPDFETTWDPRGADFAMMLGVFYCARLDAPLIAEVERDGVPYARVYDIRERWIETILAPAKLEPLS